MAKHCIFTDYLLIISYVQSALVILFFHNKSLFYRVVPQNVLIFFGNNFYKNKETFKIFSSQTQILEVDRILLVEITLESITFYYTFSVINTMLVPCTALLYVSRASPPRLKLTLPWSGDLPPRSFYTSASTKTARRSVATSSDKD